MHFFHSLKASTKAVCLAGAFISAAQATQAATAFDIDISFGGGLTASQQAAFTTAETFLESIISGFAYEISGFTGPTISAAGVSIDGPNGVLGQAGPQTFYYDNTVPISPFAYTITGLMQFDTADLSAMETAGVLEDVIVHEMAHVLGFGTLWDVVGAYVPGSGQYTGPGGLLGYQLQCDAAATYVPVEQDGGPGTADGHWDEDWACGPNALLTGYLDAPAFLSWATVGAFADLGYIINIPDIPAVPLPAGVLLLGTGLGGFGLLRRRQNKRG